MVADFEKQSYWHDRFAKETSFEWLTPSATFMNFIEPYLWPSRAQRILHLGFGTSDLHNRFRERGYEDVTNIDYEPLAIDHGKEAEKSCFGDVQMKYAVADITKLHTDLPQPRAFDLIVDKCTTDAVCCGGDAAFLNMAHNVYKCLAAGGVWISLSYSVARFDVDDLPFEARVIGKFLTPKAKVGDPDVYYWCYMLRPR